MYRGDVASTCGQLDIREGGKEVWTSYRHVNSSTWRWLWIMSPRKGEQRKPSAGPRAKS